MSRSTCSAFASPQLVLPATSSQVQVKRVLPRRLRSRAPDVPRKPPVVSPPRAAAAHSETFSDTVTMRKMRVSLVLQHELPRLMRLEGGPREMFRGGEHEMFTPEVEFSFPVWAGKGRRLLKMLLMSLPLQASCGLLYPVIEDIEIASPSRLRLDVRYNVRCSALGSDDTNARPEGSRSSSGIHDYTGSGQSRSTTLRVLTRLHFDEQGRIAEWRDTWDKGVPQLLKDVAQITEDTAVFHERAAAEAVVEAAKSENADVRHQTAHESEPEDPVWTGDSIWDGSDGVDLAGQRLASRIVPSGPPLAAPAMAARMGEVEKFLRIGFCRYMLPGANVEDAYRLFHRDSVLETYDFVVEGIESLALLQSLSRADVELRFSVMEARCTHFAWKSPRIAVASYMFRGRRRVGGCLYQNGISVGLHLNKSGEVVLAKVFRKDLRDDTFDIFAQRSSNRVWIW